MADRLQPGWAYVGGRGERPPGGTPAGPLGGVYHEPMRAGASGPMRPTHHGYLEGASTMCLNCGCMQAHNDMGKPGVNIVYEDLKKASDANGKTVEETLEMMNRTASLDRATHPAEYGLEREAAVR